MEFILAERKSGETIVALDLTQYFPAKYYVGQRAKIRMVEPPFDLFWGTHLVRRGDTICARPRSAAHQHRSTGATQKAASRRS